MSRIDKPTVIILLLSAALMVMSLCMYEEDKPVNEDASIRQQEKIDRAYEAYISEVETEIIRETYHDYLEPDVRYDVGLSEAFQIWLIDYCYDRDISPYLVMAIIEHESGCDAGAVGDAGESIGLMQIQPRWDSERMDRLGVTDLTDPYQNVMVGVDILLELFSANPDVSWVLMSYNGWTGYADRMKAAGHTSTYAREIMDRAYRLEES